MQTEHRDSAAKPDQLAGAKTSFTVTATGSGSLGYQWKLNGVDLTDGLCFSGATNPSLTVNYVLWSPCHHSEYTVVVTSPAGAVTSAPAILTVIPPLPDDPVPFADPNLEVAVRVALSMPPGPVAVSNLWALTALTACGQHITNLSGLEYATNLMCLYLPRNGVRDLAPLQCLNRLVQVGLYQNRIIDLSPLTTLTTLTDVDLGDNLIAEGRPLANLTGLRRLWLHGNTVSNLMFLTRLRSVR